MAQLGRSENHVVDNICNPIGPLAIGFYIRYRQRHQPDSSLVGPGCDRIDIQPGHWPAHRLEKHPSVRSVGTHAEPRRHEWTFSSLNLRVVICTNIAAVAGLVHF